MNDIAPKLLEKLQKSFSEDFDKSEKIKELYNKVRDGTSTYAEANKFAIEVGNILANVFEKNISADILPDGKMYYNIAGRVISPMMKSNYELIAELSAQVQESLNKSSRIGIKAIKAELNKDRIKGIVDKVANAEKYEDVKWVLKEPIKTFSQSVVDDAIKANADFHANAGMRPKIIRKVAGNCCDWCKNIAGEYLYPNVPQDVYRRHNRCKCTVEYYPGDGKVQNVHSKVWYSNEESGNIDKRKNNGEKIYIETPSQREKRVERDNNLSLPARIAEHPKMLGAYTPESLKKSLSMSGCEVKSLKKGKYKGLSFGEGGGYKVNFGGDGILQYHPEKGSHHGGEYYKIGTGKLGLKWYNMKGEEIDVEKTAELGRQITK